MGAYLNGYIKIHRKLLQWGWYQDSVVKDVFFHLLLVAAFKNSIWMGQKIKAGQAVIGLQKMADELGFSIQQIRTALKKLESTGEIRKKSTNKFTIITVVNWAEYQIIEEEEANEQQTANKQTTKEQQHRKNVKKDKNVKKEVYGEYKNVLLTSEEYQTLLGDFPDLQNRIERLSEYIESKGARYKSHFVTIRAWAEKDKREQELKAQEQTKRYKPFEPEEEPAEKIPMPEELRIKIGQALKLS